MQVYKWHHTASWEFLVFCALRLGVSLTAVGGLFVQMLCHAAWQYVNYCLRVLPCLCANILAHSGKLSASASCRCFCFFVQMLCHVAWQYVNYCLRVLPCLCAKIHAHSGKLNTSASCEWGGAASKQRSFCANAVSCRLWVCKLLPARPSLPLCKYPRPQRQAQRLGVVPVFLLFSANAVSCRLAICILLPARPSLPLHKDPRPQR